MVPFTNVHGHQFPVAGRAHFHPSSTSLGSFEANPAFTADKLGWWSDFTSRILLSDGLYSYGMGFITELAETFAALNETLKEATNELWLRIGGWSRDPLPTLGAPDPISPPPRELAHSRRLFSS